MTTKRAESMVARGAEAPKEAKNLQGGAQLECHLHPDESLLLKTKMTGTQPRQKNKPSCRSGARAQPDRDRQRTSGMKSTTTNRSLRALQAPSQGISSIPHPSLETQRESAVTPSWHQARKSSSKKNLHRLYCFDLWIICLPPIT